MKDWIWWAAAGFVAYYLYQNVGWSLVSTVANASGYVPIANSRGDQFSCPVGTKFTEIESMVNGSGVCQ